ncbi:hypothetical protein QBC39DRAFT_100002 [Podospora conica]|nr:hypothetical protein QBC39DRAFT_100002 [Schizothecium conicum]
MAPPQQLQPAGHSDDDIRSAFEEGKAALREIIDADRQPSETEKKYQQEAEALAAASRAVAEALGAQSTALQKAVEPHQALEAGIKELKDLVAPGPGKDIANIAEGIDSISSILSSIQGTNLPAIQEQVDKIDQLAAPQGTLGEIATGVRSLGVALSAVNDNDPDDHSAARRLRAIADVCTAMKIRDPGNLNKRTFGTLMNALSRALMDKEKRDRVRVREFLESGTPDVVHCISAVVYGDGGEAGECTCQRHTSGKVWCTEIVRHQDGTTAVRPLKQ